MADREPLRGVVDDVLRHVGPQRVITAAAIAATARQRLGRDVTADEVAAVLAAYAQQGLVRLDTPSGGPPTVTGVSQGVPRAVAGTACAGNGQVLTTDPSGGGAARPMGAVTAFVRRAGVHSRHPMVSLSKGKERANQGCKVGRLPPRGPGASRAGLLADQPPAVRPHPPPAAQSIQYGTGPSAVLPAMTSRQHLDWLC